MSLAFVTVQILLCLLCCVYSQPIIRSVMGIAKFGGDGRLAINANIQGPVGVFQWRKEVYFTDSQNHVIRKVDKNGIISTIAGIAGQNSNGGDETKTTLNNPYCIYVTTNKDIYFCDGDNHAIRKISSSGIISTVAGGLGQGSGENNLLANETKLFFPTCIFVTESNDEVYICDSDNHVIRKILNNGTMTIVAGTLAQSGYVDGPTALQSKLASPRGVFVSTNQDIYIADTFNDVIRKLFPNGTITTIAGSYTSSYSNCSPKSGDGGLATQAKLCKPSSLQYLEESNSLLIADSDYCVIRKIDLTTNIISTIAGTVCAGIGYTGDFEPAIGATFQNIVGLFVNEQGELLVVDNKANAIRKIVNGIVIPFVGTHPQSDKADSNLKFSVLNQPNSVHITTNGSSFVADTLNHVIKRIEANGTVSIIAGQFQAPGFSGDNGPATQAQLRRPNLVVYHEANSELFISDKSNNLLRKVDKNGIITTICGSTTTILNPNKQLANETYLRSVQGLFLLENELYLSDDQYGVIRKIFLNNGSISIVAGIENKTSYSGDGGLAIHAELNPYALYVTSQKEIFVADKFNNAIRFIDSLGNITTLIGPKSISNFVSITDTELFRPSSLYVDEVNDILYVSDEYVIKKINLSNYTMQIIAGRYTISNFAGDYGEASKSLLNKPTSVFVKEGEVVYFADSSNNVIRKIANMCQYYEMSNTLMVANNQTWYAQMNRYCVTNSEYFLVENLPIVTVKYNETNTDLTTQVLSNWNHLESFSTQMFESNQLDLLILHLDGCSSSVNISHAACSKQIEYATLPTSNEMNFLFFFSTSAQTITFIHLLNISPSVSSLQMTLQFNNTRRNQIDKIETIQNGASTSIDISGLQHSTNYEIQISTQVQYKNGLHFHSTVLKRFQTEMGTAPIGTLQHVTLNLENEFQLAWQSVPPNQQGNVPINRIEILMTNSESLETMQQELSLISISYDASTNIPNSYVITTYQFNTYYLIQLKVCNDVGCGNWTNALEAMIPSIGTLKTESIIAIVVPIATVGLLLILLLLLSIVIVVFTIILIALKHKKKQQYITSDVMEQEMMEELVSKEFRIEESKINMTNSQFLGSGASGSVFTATYFNHTVAVKTIAKSIAGVENDLRDFYNELKFLNSNAQHVNIIRFFGVYENVTKNTLGLVMEFCACGDLSTYIEKHPMLSFAQKLDFIKGIANGMQYLHHHNIAHRDLKCENVLLDSSLVPKIIDFGYSRVIAEEANKTFNLTMNIGTAVYCAPEVIKLQVSTGISLLENQSNIASINSITSQSKLAYDKKCDVYSFAICIFVIYFQNKTPYGYKTSPNQVLLQLSSNPDFRPKYDDSSIPENEKWLMELMKQCWATKPEERPSFETICNILSENS